MPIGIVADHHSRGHSAEELKVFENFSTKTKEKKTKEKKATNSRCCGSFTYNKAVNGSQIHSPKISIKSNYFLNG